MLVSSTRLIGLPILSVQFSGIIAHLGEPIVDPDSLKILGFFVPDSPVSHRHHILDVRSIREYSHLGVVIDSDDEFLTEEDVIRIRDALALKFDPIGLKVETKKHSNLGRVANYTVTTDDFLIQQLIVRRPLLKSLSDPELTIPRSEIVEVSDTKIIVKDDEKTIRARASEADFIPNFVNPFRNHEPDYAPTQMKNPDDINIE